MMKSTGEIIALTARKRTHPVLFAFGGFIAGVIVMLAWNFESGIGPSTESATSSNTPIATQGFPPNHLISIDTQPSGNIAHIASVKAPGAWAAVHELRGTVLGNVLGAARVTGTGASIDVSLLRNTERDRDYAVVLYRDDGDGEFSLDRDSVFVDYETGERVVAPFKTTP